MYMSSKTLSDLKKIRPLTEKLPESVESSRSVSHRVKCQESLIKENIHNQKNLTKNSNIRKAKLWRVTQFNIIWFTPFLIIWP